MPVGDAMVRFDRATMAVRNARIIGSARDDETILKESGTETRTTTGRLRCRKR
jgi:hypothetical protein